MSELKLLPCPFCGGEAAPYHVDQCEDEGEPAAFVMCNLCNAQVPWSPGLGAIAAWNRRAFPASGEREGLADHKWLDPECGVHGCQSLVWRSRYEAAINGRRDFRKAFKDTRAAIAVRDEALRQAADRLDNFIAAMSLPIPDAIHMKALRSGLPEVASDLRKALASHPSEGVKA